MGGKLLLRFMDHRKKARKKDIYEAVLTKLKTPLTNLKETPNGYNAFFEFETDAEKLLTEPAQQILNNLGLTARLPPNLKAKRSVICRKIESFVGEHTKEELLEEINRANTSITAKEVIKFKQYTHVFKIEFATTRDAEHAKTHGLLCFYTKISPSQIEQEKYIDLLMCFTCYAYENHTTDQCPHKGKKFCSECSSTEHTHIDCNPNNTKKCLNCKQNHRTMAMACPIKKEKMRIKLEKQEEDKKTKAESPYKRAVEKALANKPPVPDNDTNLRAILMIIDAHAANIAKPGSYNDRLNATLKLNNIEPIKFPTTNYSSTFLQKITNTTIAEITETPVSPEPQQQPPRIQLPRENRSRSRESRTNRRDSDALTTPDSILDSHIQFIEPTMDTKQIGVKITANRNKVKQGHITGQQMRQHLAHGNIKIFRTQDCQHTDESIDKLIYDEKISAKHQDIEFLDYETFKKTKLTIRSPDHEPHRKRQKQHSGKDGNSNT